tara:strand:- start:994 stop:1854 length:861 start_codon:yes stop_codon:yes gene_type:complete
MNIRKIIKEEIDDFGWVSQHMDSVPDDDVTLVVYLTYGVEHTIGLKEMEWGYYGIPAYINEDGHEFVIGTEDEYKEGLYQYYKEQIEEYGVEGGWNESYVKPLDWIIIPDGWIDDFCQEESEYYVDDLDTGDIMREVSLESTFDELTEQLDNINNEIRDLELEGRPLEPDSDEFGDLTDKINELEDERTDIELQLHDLVDRSIEQIKGSVYGDMKDEIGDDPITYLVNRFGMEPNAVIDSMGFVLDSEGMARHLTQFRFFGEMNHEDGEYTTENVGNETYYIMKVA